MVKRNNHSFVLGDRIIQNFKFLKNISRVKSEKKLQQLLANSNCNELLALVEISSNILAGRFCLSKKQRNRLIPFAHFVRKIARIRGEKSARRLFLNQKGGQLAVLAALLSPVLAEATNYLITKIAKNGK